MNDIFYFNIDIHLLKKKIQFLIHYTLKRVVTLKTGLVR